MTHQAIVLTVYLTPNFLHAPKNCPRPRQTKHFSITDRKHTTFFLEIGAGKGKHAMQFAGLNADKHLIAIERTREKFNAFQKTSRSW